MGTEAVRMGAEEADDADMMEEMEENEMEENEMGENEMIHPHTGRGKITLSAETWDPKV
jgi:hypothetical protein